MVVLILTMLFACESDQEKSVRLEKSRLRQKCVSKSSGSQPECWDEQDWKAFCEKVRCK